MVGVVAGLGALQSGFVAGRWAVPGLALLSWSRYKDADTHCEAVLAIHPANEAVQTVACTAHCLSNQ